MVEREQLVEVRALGDHLIEQLPPRIWSEPVEALVRLLGEQMDCNPEVDIDLVDPVAVEQKRVVACVEVEVRLPEREHRPLGLLAQLAFAFDEARKRPLPGGDGAGDAVRVAGVLAHEVKVERPLPILEPVGRFRRVDPSN